MTKLITKRHARHTKKINISFRSPKCLSPVSFPLKKERKSIPESKYNLSLFNFPHEEYENIHLQIEAWNQIGNKIQILSFHHPHQPQSGEIYQKEGAYMDIASSLALCLSICRSCGGVSFLYYYCIALLSMYCLPHFGWPHSHQIRRCAAHFVHYCHHQIVYSLY